MASGGCGSIVIASVAGECSGPSLAVMATGWSKPVYCISVSWEFEAGSTVAAVSSAWAGVAVVGISVAWADDGTVAVALECLVL